jgi:hypothetical protein
VLTVFARTVQGMKQVHECFDVLPNMGQYVRGWLHRLPPVELRGPYPTAEEITVTRVTADQLVRPMAARYIDDMSASRDHIPPGLITNAIAYGVFVGCLGAIRYFDLTDFFFPRDSVNIVTIVAVLIGLLYSVGHLIFIFRPQWIDLSKNNIGGD